MTDNQLPTEEVKIFEPPKSEFLARYWIGDENLFANNMIKFEITCYRDISEEGKESLINCLKQVINDYSTRK